MDLSKPFQIFTDRNFLAGVAGALAEAILEKTAFVNLRPTFGYANETGDSLVIADSPGSTKASQQKMVNRQAARVGATAAVMYLAGASGNPLASSAAIGFGVVAIAHVIQDLFPAQLVQPARK